MRVGLGHDIHRFGGERPLVIGGVAVEYHRGLVGHSDADVLLHAVTDALLGAAGLGDIGEWFPDTAAEWEAADSAQFVKRAVTAIQERGWQVVNLDCTIFAEQPKLSPYKKDIAENIAELLHVGPDCVNVKAKTGEKVGPVGEELAIAADAVVLLEKTN